MRRQWRWAPFVASSVSCRAERIEGARLAARAVEFGQGDGNVLWMSADVVWHLVTDAARAKELADRSLAINPNSAMALTTLAWIESSARRNNSNPFVGPWSSQSPRPARMVHLYWPRGGSAWLKGSRRVRSPSCRHGRTHQAPHSRQPHPRTRSPPVGLRFRTL
jgi:hypothetical protein